MRRGLKQSLALHAVVLLVVIFGLPHFSDEVMMMSAPVPVEIVSPDQVSSAPPRQHTPPAQPQPPKPAPEQPPPPPTPTPPPPPPEPDDVPSPEPPKPQEPQPKPPEQQTQVTPPRPPRPRPPVPAAQRQPQQQRPRPNNQFANMLNNLSQQQDDQPPQEGSPDSPVEQPANISSVLNASELDAVRQQVMSCWLEPTGLREGDRMVVEIKVEVNQDRTVRSARVVDTARMRSDSFYRTLAESAVRAMYNPRCSPLKLPADKYSTWRSITFRFSPGEIY